MALEDLTAAQPDPALAQHHRLHTVRAHLPELAGDHEAARSGYAVAASRTRSLPEQRYLQLRAARLRAPRQTWRVAALDRPAIERVGASLVVA